MKNSKTTDKKFLISAKKVLLTYPKCPLLLDKVLEKLKKIFSNNIIESYVICKELHQDGSPHIHAYVKTLKKNSTINCNKYDLIDEDKSYHGQYESVRDENYVIEYILKGIKSREDPNYLISENLIDRVTDLGVFIKTEESLLKLAENGEVDKALELYKKAYPFKYLHNHAQIRKSFTELALIKSGDITPKFKFKDYYISPALQQFLDNYNPNKTVVLLGEAGYGKTQFLIAWLKEVKKLNPLVINNVDSLRLFNKAAHDVIIFDDCGKWHLPAREELIKYLDSEVPTTHSIKHGSVAIDKVSRFVVENIDPKAILEGDKAIQRRIQVIRIEESLIPKEVLDKDKN
jgi:hypothetical protein